MSATRVVVTGLGATSPVGGDVATTWARCSPAIPASGRSTTTGPSSSRSRSPARSRSSPTEVLDRVKARRLDRSGQFALVAALEAWADSGLASRPESTPERPGVAMASGIGGVQTLLSNYDALKEKGPRRVSPLAVPMLMPNAPAANVGLASAPRPGCTRRCRRARRATRRSRSAST